jgi:arylsulfatase A-like enzyme
MIIRTPDMKARGQKSHALTEFVDIYPTLCDVAGIPIPPHAEGTSYKPLLSDPDQPWKTGAFSLYPRNVAGVGDVMGRTIRTDRYRFIEWTNEDASFREVELYDHVVDPKENVNIAYLSENIKIVESLTGQLHDGWQKAMPQGNR